MLQTSIGKLQAECFETPDLQMVRLESHTVREASTDKVVLIGSGFKLNYLVVLFTHIPVLKTILIHSVGYEP
jgi:hypothetical protein